MKDADGLILFLVIAAVAVIIFMGVIEGVRRSFKKVPPAPQADSSLYMEEQKRRVSDMQYEQKQRMEDMQQRIRDMQR